MRIVLTFSERAKDEKRNRIKLLAFFFPLSEGDSGVGKDDQFWI